MKKLPDNETPESKSKVTRQENAAGLAAIRTFPIYDITYGFRNYAWHRVHIENRESYSALCSIRIRKGIDPVKVCPDQNIEGIKCVLCKEVEAKLPARRPRREATRACMLCLKSVEDQPSVVGLMCKECRNIRDRLIKRKPKHCEVCNIRIMIDGKCYPCGTGKPNTLLRLDLGNGMNYWQQQAENRKITRFKKKESERKENVAV